MKHELWDAECVVRIKKLLCLAAIVLMSMVYFEPTAITAEKWSGVDESVVEKYAKEHGREARTPYINTDQGDLLLFVFLLGGTIGGFVAGYYWRVLMFEKVEKHKKEE